QAVDIGVLRILHQLLERLDELGVGLKLPRSQRYDVEHHALSLAMSRYPPKEFSSASTTGLRNSSVSAQRSMLKYHATPHSWLRCSRVFQERPKSLRPVHGRIFPRISNSSPLRIFTRANSMARFTACSTSGSS